MSQPGPIEFRYHVVESDRRVVRDIVASTGFFGPGEVDVAVELVDDCLAKGPKASGYWFVFAQHDGQTLGYACYGPIAVTHGSYDLYWIAVGAAHQRQGLGQTLLAESERLIAAAGGRRVYVETSNRPQYAPTRAFYERCRYEKEAVIKEFYAPGDDKVIYVKVVGP